MSDKNAPVLELYAEELPDQINYSAASCCWASIASFNCVGSVGSTASTASTGTTASSVC